MVNPMMSSIGHPTVLLSSFLSAVMVTGIAHAAEPVRPADILAWERRDFADPTLYQLDEYAGQTLLRAQCRDAASALYLETTVDLRETPILEWSWMVGSVFDNIDETGKSGDDYPVRLYVVKDGGLLAWRTRAVNYVWSSHQPTGAQWTNAYASQAQMLALQSGPPEQTKLVTERRNVREDFERLHGVTLDSVDGIAIMTDCDDSGQAVTGWYGSIRWLPAGD
jgi:hypothetical protein